MWQIKAGMEQWREGNSNEHHFPPLIHSYRDTLLSDFISSLPFNISFLPVLSFLSFFHPSPCPSHTAGGVVFSCFPCTGWCLSPRRVTSTHAHPPPASSACPRSAKQPPGQIGSFIGGTSPCKVLPQALHYCVCAMMCACVKVGN